MKELSQIKPGLKGEAAKQAVFETSLTHIKYKYAGEETSTNLVAFNSLGDYAINKNGGIFSGPIQVKSATSKIINLTSTMGIVTINLGFGNFFRLEPKENISAFEIINAAPEVANTFTLIVAYPDHNLSNPPLYYVPLVFQNASLKWPGDLPSYVTIRHSNRDIFSFKTTDGGSTWYAAVLGKDFLFVGYPVYGTFIRSEINYIDIDGIQYANGTVDIVADGTGGETYGTIHYPPGYPETGYTTFKYVQLPAVRADQIYPEEYFLDFGVDPSELTTIAGTHTVSDGSGGYFDIVIYPGNDYSFGVKEFYFYLNTQSILLGTRNYFGDGLGHVTFNVSHVYENGHVLAGPINDYTLTFATDEWYSSEGFPGGYLTDNIPWKGTYVIKANGLTTINEYTYPEEGTVLTVFPRLIGFAYDYQSPDPVNQTSYQKSIYAPANYVADGSGNVKIVVTIQPGSFLPIGPSAEAFTSDYSQIAPYADTIYNHYSSVGCGTCVYQGIPAPECYIADLNTPSPFGYGCYTDAYAARAIYDPTKWSSNSVPPPGHGYFRIEIIPNYKQHTEEFWGYYDFIINEDQYPWVELPSASS